MSKKVKEGKVPDVSKENIEAIIKTLLEMKDKFVIREDVEATIKADGKEIAIVAVPGGYQITMLELNQPALPAAAPEVPPVEPGPVEAPADEVPAEPEKEEEPVESARIDKGVDEGKVPAGTPDATQDGVIKDLLEKHGLKEDAAPVTGQPSEAPAPGDAAKEDAHAPKRKDGALDNGLEGKDDEDDENVVSPSEASESIRIMKGLR